MAGAIVVTEAYLGGASVRVRQRTQDDNDAVKEMLSRVRHIENVDSLPNKGKPSSMKKTGV